MKELLELHILQNFSPSNLNRDDTGSPKDAIFGGARRARVSSQAFKRAMRTYVRQSELLPPEHMAERSRLFNKILVDSLVAAGKDEIVAHAVVKLALEVLGLKLDKKTDSHTEYLIFLGKKELDTIEQLLIQNWDELAAVALAKKSKKAEKDAAVSKELKKALEAAVRERGDGGDAVDVALFGRMLADRPDKNQDAACQVAHAISTHKISKEFDYYTAVDELLHEDDSGAGMVGTTEFNSACFYRYLAIDLALLKANLKGDEELMLKGLRAFTEAAIRAVPSGKQNSFAAHNPPSFVAIRHRKNTTPINLANAFEKPIWPGKDSLTQKSVEELAAHWGKLDRFYGNSGETVHWSDAGSFSHGERVESIEAMLDTVLSWAREN
jgi:CRISPR system Cascade subunit CasC